MSAADRRSSEAVVVDRSAHRSAPVLILAVTVLLLGLAGCGGSSDNSGTPTLKWYVYKEPSGSFATAAKRCTTAAHGRYRVENVDLPNNADEQREQLVRRLAAKDSDIDIIGMDVIWTAEFAGARWIRPWPAAKAQQATAGRLRPGGEERHLPQPPLRRTPQQQRPDVVVPHRPHQAAAPHVERDDRVGSGLREEGQATSRAGPGPALRRARGVVHLAARVGRGHGARPHRHQGGPSDRAHPSGPRGHEAVLHVVGG